MFMWSSFFLKRKTEVRVISDVESLRKIAFLDQVVESLGVL